MDNLKDKFNHKTLVPDTLWIIQDNKKYTKSDTCNNYLLKLQSPETFYLIDTGSGIFNIRQYIENFILNGRNQPIKVLLTHTHFDHSGGIKYFDEIYVNQIEKVRIEASEKLTYDIADPDSVRNWMSNTFNFVPVDSEKIFTFDQLNDERIQILNTPGHSPGSCCIYVATGPSVLFSGDTLYRKPTIVNFPTSDIAMFKESLQTLKKIIVDLEIEMICPGHYFAGRKKEPLHNKDAIVWIENNLSRHKGIGSFLSLTTLYQGNIID